MEPQARPAAVAVLALSILVALQGARVALDAKARGLERHNEALAERAAEAAAVAGELAFERDQRAAALTRFRAGLPKLTEDRRQIYETGLQLQEEKRMLEKQLEIITTYLLVDEASRQVHVMRGEQALETYPIGLSAPRAHGGAKSAAQADVVVSKERFAHPERPKAEQVAGQLQWEPPQAGTSARVNALGEYVMFTRGSLIVHGPPTKSGEHELYPHSCLELSLPVARRLYQASFIGTRVVLKAAVVKKK